MSTVTIILLMAAELVLYALNRVDRRYQIREWSDYQGVGSNFYRLIMVLAAGLAIVVGIDVM